MSLGPSYPILPHPPPAGNRGLWDRWALEASSPWYGPHSSALVLACQLHPRTCHHPREKDQVAFRKVPQKNKQELICRPVWHASKGAEGRKESQTTHTSKSSGNGLRSPPTRQSPRAPPQWLPMTIQTVDAFSASVTAMLLLDMTGLPRQCWPPPAAGRPRKEGAHTPRLTGLGEMQHRGEGDGGDMATSMGFLRERGL